MEHAKNPAWFTTMADLCVGINTQVVSEMEPNPKERLEFLMKEMRSFMSSSDHKMWVEDIMKRRKANGKND